MRGISARRLLSVVVVVATSVPLAAQSPPAADVLPGERAPEPDGFSGIVLSAAALTWATATAPAFAVGAGLTSLANFNVGIGALGGALVGVGITYFMLPALVTRWGDDDEYAGSIRAARDEGWRQGWVPVAVMGAGLTALAVGSYVSDELAIGGAVVAGISYGVAWVLEVTGVRDGYLASRRARE